MKPALAILLVLAPGVAWGQTTDWMVHYYDSRAAHDRVIAAVALFVGVAMLIRACRKR